MHVLMFLCLDLILGFEDKNYSVSDKNIPDEPVIKFMRYPLDLNGLVKFPINVTVIEDDKTAVGKLVVYLFACQYC